MTVKKLIGDVLNVERTGEIKIDGEGQKWEKCIFTLKIKSFSKRAPNEKIPNNIMGKEVKQVRWCCYDWHYESEIKTLDADETIAILEKK